MPLYCEPHCILDTLSPVIPYEPCTPAPKRELRLILTKVANEIPTLVFPTSTSPATSLKAYRPNAKKVGFCARPFPKEYSNELEYVLNVLLMDCHWSFQLSVARRLPVKAPVKAGF